MLRILLFVTLLGNLTAQSTFNYVPNPGFEEFYHLPKNLSATHHDFIQKSKFWSTANNGTSDLIHTSTDTKLWFESVKPHSGNMMAGILVNNESYAEYLKIELKEDLVPGQSYYGEFWVTCPATFMNQKSNIQELNTQFGLLADQNFFLDHTRVIAKKTTIAASQGTTPVPTEWLKISAEFKVERPCSNIYIGQFLGADKKISVGYYLIDDIFIGNSSDQKYLKPIEEITSQTKSSFDNILFEFGQSTLLSSSFAQLDIIAEAIKQSNKKCTVIGHTDNEGSGTANQLLSLNRAKAVQAYLLSKGLSINMINCIGKGESEPVAPNDTDQGKQKNRRVEIILN